MNTADQILALTTGCRYCGAPKHQPCTNKLTGHPTRLNHPIRINDAKHHPHATSDVDDEELPF
jgi:hypothetical protein